jgi:hypothetical protein
MLGDDRVGRRLLPTQSVSGHAIRDRLHLVRSEAGKFGVKRFLVLREVASAEGGGLFWATSLEKNYRRRDRAHLVPPAAGWMQQSAVPSCAILSVGSTGDEMIQ